MCLLVSYDSSPLFLWLRVSLFLSFLSFWGKFDLFEAAWQSSYDSYLRQQDCESNHSLVCLKQTCCSLSSQLSSALMRHHVADMSPINSLCVILIKKLIDQNQSRNKTGWELPAVLFWHDSIKGDITKLCSTSEKILSCPHKSQQFKV